MNGHVRARPDLPVLVSSPYYYAYADLGRRNPRKYRSRHLFSWEGGGEDIFTQIHWDSFISDDRASALVADAGGAIGHIDSRVSGPMA